MSVMSLDYYYFLLCTKKKFSYDYLIEYYNLPITKINKIMNYCIINNYIKLDSEYENLPMITKSGIDFMNELSKKLKLKGCKKYIIPYNIYRSKQSENDIYIPKNFI